MTITYRNLKGAPLSADELDQNFRELHQRLEELEEGKASAGVRKITQEGPDILFESTTGEILGRVTVPLMHFRPRGPWASRENYLFYDLCLFEEKTYLCKTPHKSGDDFESGRAYWDIIFGGD